MQETLSPTGSRPPTLAVPQETPEAFRHYQLCPLLPPGHTLALNLALGTLSLLAADHGGPHLVAQQHFTDSEVCVLLPLLESYPHFCPYEILLASFNSLSIAEDDIEASRARLSQASVGKQWDQEMRPVRNVLSRTRLKLHWLGIDVFSLMETGYLLMPKRQSGRRTRHPAVKRTEVTSQDSGRRP